MKSNVKKKEQITFYQVKEVKEICKQYPTRIAEGIAYFLYKYNCKRYAFEAISKELGTPAVIYFPFAQLATYMGKDYVKEVIEKLESKGILKRTGKLSKYKHKFYQFHPLPLTPTTMDYLTDKLLINRIARNQDKQPAIVKKLATYLGQCSIEMSKKEYEAAAIECYKNSCEKNKTKKISFQQYSKKYNDRYNELQLFSKAKGKAVYDYIEQDTFSGRIHTPITRLPRILKDKGVIKIRKANTVSLDLHQCQPLILSNLLSQFNPLNDFTKTINKEKDIYTYLKENLNLKTRNEAKNVLFIMMFGNIYNKYYKKFKALFPIASGILRLIKSQDMPDMPKYTPDGKNNYKNVAWLMQTREVQIFMELWNTLFKNKIRFVTIHDEILVREQDQQAAKEIMNDVFSCYFPKFDIHE